MKVAILGLGKIARSVVAGLAAVPPGEVDAVVATRRTPTDADRELALPGLTVLGTAERPDANLEAVHDADVAFLCVKPYQVADLLAEIAPALRPDALVVSVAAGISFATLHETLGSGARVARLMPNTPTSVGLGVVGVVAAGPRADESRELLARWFAPVSVVVRLAAEAEVDVLSAVSGSGPAYFFAVVEAMAEAARRWGLSSGDAERVAAQTFVGAADLLHRSGSSAARLRADVTSPGGTTEQALAVLAQADLAAVLEEAFGASVRHARHLDA